MSLPCYQLETDIILKNWLREKSPKVFDELVESSHDEYYGDSNLNRLTYTEMVGQYVLELDLISRKFDVAAILRALAFDFKNRATNEGAEVLVHKTRPGIYNEPIPKFYVKDFFKNTEKTITKLIKQLLSKWIEETIKD